MVEPYATEGRSPRQPPKDTMDVFDWAVSCPEYATFDPRAEVYARANRLAQAVTR